MKIGKQYQIQVDPDEERRQYLNGQIVTVLCSVGNECFRCRNDELGTVEVYDDELIPAPGRMCGSEEQ